MSSIYGVLKWERSRFSEENFDLVLNKSNWWNAATKKSIKSKAFGLFHLGLKFTETDISEHKIQAFKSHDLYVVTDCRIDNKAQIIADLKLNPAISDIELIAHLYLEFKSDFAAKLLGAFSIILYDGKMDKLICARDHMGVKPLNYYYDGDQICIASHKKSIAYTNDINPRPNWTHLINRMSAREVEPNSTEYAQIKQVPPATIMTFSKDGVSSTKYWELDVTKSTVLKSDEEYEERFRHYFSQAIERRMHTTKEVGAHISGGLDSSGIAGFAQEIGLKKLGKGIHSFSYVVPENVNFEIPFSNENHLVEAQIEYSGIKEVHNIDYTIHRYFRGTIFNEALTCDGYSRTNNVNTEFEIHKSAHELGVNLILSGFPGDELVTSFTRPYYLEYLEKWQLIKYFQSKHRGNYDIKKLLLPFALKVTKPVFGTSLQRWAGIQYEIFKNKKPFKKFINDQNLFNNDYIAGSEEFNEALEWKVFSKQHHHFPISLKEYQKNHVCRAHTNRRIESENLAGLKWGLEYRYPMADIDLLQYVLSVPVDQKYRDGNTRFLYRRGLKGYSPDELRLRDNKGGSLKPSVAFKRKFKDPSIHKLWDEVKASGAIDLFDRETIQTSLDKGVVPKDFHFYMILAKLVMDEKMFI